MPHAADPRTLEELCCKNIGQNMEKIWCKHYDQHFYGKQQYLYLLGPFSHLPGVLLSRLIKYLKNNGLKIGHLQLLLDHSLVDLDLSKLSNNIGTVLNTVTNRCINLRHLDLSGNAKLPLQGQLALFSAARLLESINLSSTNTSDRVMSVIGTYCTQLSELDVRMSAVTDLGLSSLSTAAPCHQSPTAGQSLTKLSVFGCNVTPDSAYGALSRMPNLIHFDHRDSVWGVERLLVERPERAPLLLAELQGSAAAGLQVAAAGCPLCSMLRLELDGSRPALAPAAQLSRLRELTLISPCEPCPELSPLLEARGAGLTQLELNGLADLPIAHLLCHCRALRRLTLFSCFFRDVPAPGGPLPELEQFWLLEESGHPPPADLLRRVLGSPALRDLRLHNCSVITDWLLAEGLDAGGLALLHSVTLERCHHVTLEPLLRLVVQCPRLETVQALSCAQLSRRDAAQLRRLADNSGWRLQVDWS